MTALDAIGAQHLAALDEATYIAKTCLQQAKVFGQPWHDDWPQTAARLAEIRAAIVAALKHEKGGEAETPPPNP